MPKGRLNEMRPRLRDLFGEIPVTWPEIELWMRVVCRHDDVESARAQHMIKWYDVPGKIRAAKRAAGTLELYLSDAPKPVRGFYWERFRFHYR